MRQRGELESEENPGRDYWNSTEKKRESPQCLVICHGFMGFLRSSFTVSCEHLEHRAQGSCSTQGSSSGQQAHGVEPFSCTRCSVHHCFCLRRAKGSHTAGAPCSPTQLFWNIIARVFQKKSGGKECLLLHTGEHCWLPTATYWPGYWISSMGFFSDAVFKSWVVVTPSVFH